MTRICWIVLGVSVVLFSSVPHAVAGERLWLVTELSPGKPSCEEFYDKWEAPGVPSAMLAMAGLGREAIAAKGCIDKGDVATACKHWQGLLAVIDKMGPPLNESGGDIENLMLEHKCEAAPASNSATETAPNSEPAPASQANPASEPHDADAPAENPDADK